MITSEHVYDEIAVAEKQIKEGKSPWKLLVVAVKLLLNVRTNQVKVMKHLSVPMDKPKTDVGETRNDAE